MFPVNNVRLSTLQKIGLGLFGIHYICLNSRVNRKKRDMESVEQRIRKIEERVDELKFKSIIDTPY